MRHVLAALCLLAAAAAAEAQTSTPPSEAKIEQLLELLRDPAVQEWLESGAGRPSSLAKPSSDATVATWESATRQRIRAVISAMPRIPDEVSSAAMRIRQDTLSHNHAPLFIIFAALIGAGLVAETAFRKRSRKSDGPIAALLPIAVFAAPIAIVFFAVDWPPLSRVVLFVCLLAILGYRLVSAILALAEPAADRRMRARLFSAVGIFAIATAVVGQSAGMDANVVNAISYLFSIALLAIGAEAAWSMQGRSASVRAAIVAAMVGIWLLWCLDLKGLFWLAIYALVLPGALRAAGHAAGRLLPDEPSRMRTVIFVRVARAIVVALAVGWLAIVWRMNPDGLGHRDPAIAAVFYGLLKSVVLVLLADLLWQLLKSWIDETLAKTGQNSDPGSGESARRGRLRTLLPILRNALAVVVLTITALVVLAQLGVEIGPLIAGAGIFGVAIGFGSQTLVKDVISGVFYMLDDAFRVGEYIQASNYKGTVEGFSLRSVRLRHHRGPVFTVPFGELGAVENMSRDWGVVKFRISVSYNSDVEKARKLTKKIGAELMEDPELGPLFIDPLKMKGVEEFGDYGIVLSFGMTLRPSPMQSYIRRKANLLLREAFMANGIEFAHPTVNVGGEGQASSAAAAAQVLAKSALSGPGVASKVGDKA
jgi:moderate conductance mechanosensitive channel